ncbi:uncharacterized protein LOC126572603 [Anopheles aquasalis]|uniref:uncharacterized protein LOC126572603 n=1 Tax=Anopheles aquasalis TaxID=42839 RepID=UPI00215AAF2F|nr:uncharacterized protein LOC126572603 [Anopheles aquasalis]
MGTAVTPVDCYVELLLQQMLPNEESKCTIHTKQHGDITFTMKLVRIEGQQYYYEQTATSTLELAKRYKVNGVLMYSKYPAFAQAYFNRAAKCLLSWSPIEQLDPAIEGPGTIEEMQALLQTLQLNISACLIKENRFEEALHVLRFIDHQEKPSEKAIYRRALAQFRINQFNEAIATLEKINYAASKECDALYKQIVEKRQQETSKYSAMVKKMFA